MLDRIGARLCLLSLAIASCQSPPDISGDIEYFGDRINTSIGELCECHAELGFAARQECEDAMSFVDLDERACIADVLEGHEEDAQKYFGCANDALDEYLTCLQENPGCMEGWNSACTSDYEAARAACSGLGSSQLDAIEACIP